MSPTAPPSRDHPGDLRPGGEGGVPAGEQGEGLDPQAVLPGPLQPLQRRPRGQGQELRGGGPGAGAADGE